MPSSDEKTNDRKAIFAELKSEYLYICIPFILLIMVKLHSGTWQEILLSPDWSLVSCIIFGQITSKVSQAVARYSNRTSTSYFGWYTAKRFLLVVVALTCYFGMLTSPSIELGGIQALIFITASYLHFSDGVTTKLLLKNEK